MLHRTLPRGFGDLDAVGNHLDAQPGVAAVEVRQQGAAAASDVQEVQRVLARQYRTRDGEETVAAGEEEPFGRFEQLRDACGPRLGPPAPFFLGRVRFLPGEVIDQLRVLRRIRQEHKASLPAADQTPRFAARIQRVHAGDPVENRTDALHRFSLLADHNQRD